MKDEIRIYVVDLAAYNAGILHGVWVDACQDIDTIWDQVDKMLKSSPIPDAEEYAIHDFEGFGEYRLSEYSGLKSAHEFACFIKEFPGFGAALLNLYSDLEEARSFAEEHYIGCYKSLADYAQELTEETIEIPEHLKYYIDYEKMGRDMELGGDVITVETGFEEIHIFWNH